MGLLHANQHTKLFVIVIISHCLCKMSVTHAQIRTQGWSRFDTLYKWTRAQFRSFTYIERSGFAGYIRDASHSNIRVYSCNERRYFSTAFMGEQWSSS